VSSPDRFHFEPVQRDDLTDLITVIAGKTRGFRAPGFVEEPRKSAEMIARDTAAL
jgi:hypothetical protein